MVRLMTEQHLGASGGTVGTPFDNPRRKSLCFRVSDSEFEGLLLLTSFCEWVVDWVLRIAVLLGVELEMMCLGPSKDIVGRDYDRH